MMVDKDSRSVSQHRDNSNVNALPWLHKTSLTIVIKV